MARHLCSQLSPLPDHQVILELSLLVLLLGRVLGFLLSNWLRVREGIFLEVVVLMRTDVRRGVAVTGRDQFPVGMRILAVDDDRSASRCSRPSCGVVSITKVCRKGYLSS